MFADNNEISGIFVFKTEFNPLLTVSPTSYICFRLNNTEKKKKMMQLNFVKCKVLWKRQHRVFAVVFLECDDVQIPGAA